MFSFVEMRLSLKNFIQALPDWWRRDFIWNLMAAPVLFIVLMYILSDANIFGWQDSSVCKNDLEIIHPALLLLTIILSVGGWLKAKDSALLFLGFLAAFFLTRELLSQTNVSTSVVIAGIIGLIIYANRDLERIKTLLNSKWSTSLLGMCFICYFISQLFDRGFIKRIWWLVKMDTSLKLPYSSNIEEGLESLGGFFLVLTSISLIIHTRKLLKDRRKEYKLNSVKD
jgi:hypothetical protein